MGSTLLLMGKGVRDVGWSMAPPLHADVDRVGDVGDRDHEQRQDDHDEAGEGSHVSSCPKRTVPRKRNCSLWINLV